MQIDHLLSFTNSNAWIIVLISKMVHKFEIVSIVSLNHVKRFEKCDFGTMTHVLVIKTKNIIPIADDQLCEVSIA